MVDEKILNYLKKHKEEYSLKDLKKKILSSGYSKQSFENALAELKGSPPAKKETPKGSISGKGWMKFAGIIGLVFFVYGLASLVMGIFEVKLSIPDFLSIGIALVGLVLLCFYFYGFVKLSNKVNSRLLKIASILSIVVAVILLALYIWAIIGNLNAYDAAGINMSPTEEESSSIWVLYLFLAFFIFSLAVRYLFTISLIRIRKLAKFSNVAGILGLIFAVFLTLVAGYITYLIIDKEALLRFLFGLIMNPGKLEMYTWILRGMLFVSLVGVLFESFTLLRASKK